jgi:hypothetical protein
LVVKGILEPEAMERTTDMSQSNQVKAGEVAFTLGDLLRAAQELDRLLHEAVEAGVDSGRTMGVLEAYNVLVRAGHKEAATKVMELVEDENMFRKSIGDA